ncbi:unnamed protein product [Brassicogethes aeneus]|uniref:Farnesol dehydrogenase-like n=1 Tax=Brassicogethes aeneus TaxID=1431903 RepID=A0A9P0B9R3_BRAAE|nr:unnamed protein product [Brassicogethes aeneus]
MCGFERWVGKVAIVTGASSGIGADIAKELVKKGLKVVGLARRSERITELAGTLTNEPGKLYSVKCDVSKEEDVLSAFKWVKENVGLVHILINNAGLIQGTNLIEGDVQKWKTTFDVNVLGLLICTREAVKVMKEYKIDGHIVNINSVAGHYHYYSPALNVYPATKHAVTNLTESLRKEFNANDLKIKVTSVSPGAVETEIGGDTQWTLKNIPILNPEDISEGIIYALSTKPHVQVHELMIRPVGEQW